MGKHILIVEDDESIASSLAMLLEATGYTVRSVGDSASAFAQIGTRKPDAILLDYDLPGENGDVITRKLKQHNSTQDISVIIISAASYHAKEACLQAGADVFVQKPYDITTLLTTVAEAVKS